MLFVREVSEKLYRYEVILGVGYICLDCNAMIDSSEELLAHRCVEIESNVVKCFDVTGNCFTGPPT
jgi:hypothetical protein